MRLELARVLGPDRAEEATDLGREALELAEAKEASVIADEVRRFLGELGSS